MKRTTKKLVLAKETVGPLENAALGRVAGGISNESTCTYYNSCLRYCLEEPIGP